jgi:hypothetical protein
MVYPRVNIFVFFQFTARTAKDMEQWVSAICQASIQYILISPSTLPHVTTDKSVSRKAQAVSAPDYIEFVNNDDAEAVTNFNKTADEEYYDDISNVHQGNARLELKPDCDVAIEKNSPQLPPRRRPLPVPRNSLSDQEEEYDDIGVPNQHIQCTSVVGVDGIEGKNTEIQTGTISKLRPKTVQPGTVTEEGHTTLQPSTDKEGAHKEVQPETDALHTTAQPLRSAKHEMQYNAEENNDEGEEITYYDIDISDESAKAKTSPVLQKKYSIINGDRIKSLAKVLVNMPFKDGYQSKSETSNQIVLDTSTLPKPIKNNEKDTLFSLPQIPTASQDSKSDTFEQPLQTKSDLHKPNNNAEKITAVPTYNTQPSSQPPELPPRSYLKR